MLEISLIYLYCKERLVHVSFIIYILRSTAYVTSQDKFGCKSNKF